MSLFEKYKNDYTLYEIILEAIDINYIGAVNNIYEFLINYKNELSGFQIRNNLEVILDVLLQTGNHFSIIYENLESRDKFDEFLVTSINGSIANQPLNLNEKYLFGEETLTFIIEESIKIHNNIYRFENRQLTPEEISKLYLAKELYQKMIKVVKNYLNRIGDPYQ